MNRRPNLRVVSEQTGEPIYSRTFLSRLARKLGGVVVRVGGLLRAAGGHVARRGLVGTWEDLKEAWRVSGELDGWVQSEDPFAGSAHGEYQEFGDIPLNLEVEIPVLRRGVDLYEVGAVKGVRPFLGEYTVFSSSVKGYLVSLQIPHCACQAFEYGGGKACKHLVAAARYHVNLFPEFYPGFAHIRPKGTS